MVVLSKNQEEVLLGNTWKILFSSGHQCVKAKIKYEQHHPYSYVFIFFAATRNLKNREPQKKDKENTVINCERDDSSVPEHTKGMVHFLESSYELVQF